MTDISEDFERVAAGEALREADEIIENVVSAARMLGILYAGEDLEGQRMKLVISYLMRFEHEDPGETTALMLGLAGRAIQRLTEQKAGANE